MITLKGSNKEMGVGVDGIRLIKNKDK